MTNDEWCDFNDMLKSACSHCRNTPEVAATEKPFLGTIVVAKKRTKCPVCGEMIEVGDHIGPIMEEGIEQEFQKWAHYGCGR